MLTLAVAVMALLAIPVAVLANTSDAIAQTGGMTATLPLLGSSLTVQVTLDGSGNLSTVDIDPVGSYSASKVGAHAVTFDSADGTSQVKIRAKGDRLSVKAKAATLDALLGSGTWSADVFGTGAKSSVSYTVGKASDGSPAVVVGSVDAAAGITAETGTPKTKSGKHGASASASVAFSLDGFTKKLTIRVSAKATGNHAATLALTLSGKDRQVLLGALAGLVGSHTWSGKLCDGTAAGLSYDVLANGTVAYGSATGGTVSVKSRDSGFTARFDGTRVKVKVSLRQAKDGTYALTSKRSGCGGLHQQVPDPTVNTPVKAGASQPGDNKGHGSSRGPGHGGGHNGGGHNGGGHH